MCVNDKWQNNDVANITTYPIWFQYKWNHAEIDVFSYIPIENTGRSAQCSCQNGNFCVAKSHLMLYEAKSVRVRKNYFILSCACWFCQRKKEERERKINTRFSNIQLLDVVSDESGRIYGIYVNATMIFRKLVLRNCF